MPIVSVIVPSYRVEAYIAKCLDSLIVQDFHDFDVHVIDDGSPENERVIVEPYAQKYPISFIIGVKPMLVMVLYWSMHSQTLVQNTY